MELFAELKYWKGKRLRLFIILYAYLCTISFQIDGLVIIAIPPFYPAISWNIAPEIPTTSICLQVVQVLARFYINLVFWIIMVNHAVFAANFSFIFLQFSLFGGMDFLRRLNQKAMLGFDKSAELRKVVLAYKCLKLLSIQYNSIHRFSMMCPIILMCCGSFTISLYLLVLHGLKMGLVIGLMFVTFLVSTGFAQAVLFRIPAAIYNLSDLFIREDLKHTLHAAIKHGKSRSEKAELSRSLRALKPIKIQFFEGNFFESLTPLNMTQFCVSRAIDMILVDV